MAVYDSFYEFRAAPFALNPDPGFLFLSRQHREALAGLVYAVRDRKGFAVLTGEVGTGKTTLVHALLSTLGDEVQSALVFNPHLSRRDLYLHLLAEFHLPPQGSTLACVRALQKLLLDQFEAGVRVVVIIDEAHALSDDILEEVRLLSNFETSQSKLMQVLLIGQPELAQRLQNPALRQLRQRIALRCELQPLGFGELVAYVRSRLATAGGNPSLFSLRACATLYRFSGGLPRLINTLCDHALLSGFARDKLTIGPGLVRRAARDLDLPPLARVGLWPWLRSRRHAVENSGEALETAGISSLVEAGR
jgi:general secretion pathway protein A